MVFRKKEEICIFMLQYQTLYLIMTISKTENMSVVAEMLMTETNEKALTK